MPTGYTCDVQNGKVKSFRDFAMNCARAFGVLVEFRDDPDAEIPVEFVPSPYHQEKLAEAEARLQEALDMTPGVADQKAKEAYSAALQCYFDQLKTTLQEGKRYAAMMERAMHWKAPTADHVKFKEFMVEQLGSSLSHDCNVSYTEVPTLQTGEEHKLALIEKARRDVKYHAEEWEKDVARAKEKTEWISGLRKSLPRKCRKKAVVKKAARKQAPAKKPVENVASKKAARKQAPAKKPVENVASKKAVRK